MGRSRKIGIDYFPLDVRPDDKLKLIKAEFGLKGFAVVVLLWMRIYADQGYYCEWDEDVGLVFASEIGEGASLVSEILTAAIKRRLFDKTMFEKYSILTSRGIQARYFEAVERREQVDVFQEYLLIPADKLPENVNIKRFSADINPFSADRNTQSRGEESRAEESRGKESRGEEKETAGRHPSFDTLEVYAANNLRSMTATNNEELISFRDRLSDELIRHAIDEACGSGRPYYNYVRAILKRYVTEGYKTLADVRAEERSRKGGRHDAVAGGNADEGSRRLFDGETVV